MRDNARKIRDFFKNPFWGLPHVYGCRRQSRRERRWNAYCNLAVRLLLAPVAGHNPVKRSCIFCIKIWPASIPYSFFFAGLIPGDDSRFAIFVGFTKLYSRLDYLYLYYSVYIQALNWYRFFSDFEMLYLTAIRSYQASLRYQYWSLSQTGSSLDEVSSGLARMQYCFFSATSTKLSQEMAFNKKNGRTMSGFLKSVIFFKNPFCGKRQSFPLVTREIR